MNNITAILEGSLELLLIVGDSVFRLYTQLLLRHRLIEGTYNTD